jgi:NAD-dependent SIR2 family protein deacetylase
MRYKPLDACQDCGRRLEEKERVKHPRTGDLRPTLCTPCGDKLRAAIRRSNEKLTHD